MNKKVHVFNDPPLEGEIISSKITFMNLKAISVGTCIFQAAIMISMIGKDSSVLTPTGILINIWISVLTGVLLSPIINQALERLKL